MLSFRSMFRIGFLLPMLVVIGMFLTSCRSSNYALLQYQRPAHTYETIAVSNESIQADTLPVAAVSIESASMAEQTLAANLSSVPSVYSLKAHHLTNPESREPKHKWFQKLAANNDPTTLEYAPRHEPPVLTTKRKVPGLVKASLAGGVLSQGLLLLGTLSGSLWILVVLLPITSVLLGVAGLTKITRQRETYRGKGWAMSAIMLATGALGLALVAAAALATSQIIWK